VTEIHDDQRFADVDLPFELGEGDSRDPQALDEALASAVLARDAEGNATQANRTT